MRVAVVGPGAVGCFFAAHLSTTKHAVIACARRPFETYNIESSESPITGPALVVTDPCQLPTKPIDWVLVGLKAHQTSGAANWLDALCGPDTKVVAMQNGIEAEKRLAPFVNGAEIVGAVVYCAAELIEPGRVQHSGMGRLIVPETAIGQELYELFDNTGAVIEISEKHHDKAWFKLSLNSLANGLTALTGRTMEVLADPSIVALATELIAEAWRVALEDGAAINDTDAEALVHKMASTKRGTSMLYDTKAGRPTEHDAIHGAIIRSAEKYGVPVPLTRFVYGLLDNRVGCT